MHGRKKKTPEEAEVTDTERAKTEAAFASLTRVLELRKAGVVSQDVLDLTTAILMLNPELTTVWNYRRHLVGQLDWRSGNGVESEAGQGLQQFLSKELKLLEKVLHQTLKSYAVWAHRKWVLKTLVAISDQSLLREELALCRKLFEYDARNFHCWNHRLWVVGQLEDRKSLDLEISKDLIMKDPGNYSAWHVRSTALTAEYLSDSEMEMTRQAVYTEPNDQSVWQYRRWLNEEFPNTATAEDRQAIDELLELEPDAKYALLEISRRPDTPTARKHEIFGRLMEIDPMRRGYYLRLVRSL